MSGARRAAALIAALAAVVVPAAVAYGPVLHAGFVNFDDNEYVTENPRVQEGLTPAGIAWAFRATAAANWHPLTWVSHMLDVTLHGADPRGHHLSSLLLHLANAALLFLLLRDATGATGRSAFAAALFAVHPLHVESVAWVSERKDVLSTLFWFLATWAYVRHARRPSPRTLAAVAAAMAAGLLAKPMLVTLPLTLLLLDVWPLGRWDGTRSRASRLVAEKIPLLVLSVASSAITLAIQRAGDAVQPLDRFPAGARVANAIVACAAYLRKALWPADLAVFYPHPIGAIPGAAVAGAGLLLAGVTAAAFAARRRAPWLLVGWLFYLGTLVPVIGLIQVGGQGMADRYTYVPLVGIFVIASWGPAGLLELLARRKRREGSEPGGTARAHAWLAAPAAVVVLALAARTFAQAETWRDSETLFKHALRVTAGNALAHNKLGLALMERGSPGEAIGHFEEAVRLRPTYSEAYNNLGGALARTGRAEEAIARYRIALELRPAFAAAHVNLGAALAGLSRTDEAISEFSTAIEIDPGNARAWNNLGTALLSLGRAEEALGRFDQAVRLDARYALARFNRGRALAALGRAAEAEAEFRAAESLGFRGKPGHSSFSPRPDGD